MLSDDQPPQGIIANDIEQAITLIVGVDVVVSRGGETGRRMSGSSILRSSVSITGTRPFLGTGVVRTPWVCAVWSGFNAVAARRCPAIGRTSVVESNSLRG